MRTLARQFRAFAAGTELSAYQAKMLKAAQELELEAARQEKFRQIAMPQRLRAG